MASMGGEADHHLFTTSPQLLHGISRVVQTHETVHPAASCNALASEYKERYVGGMQHTSNEKSFGNGYHQPSLESSSVWPLSGPSPDMHLLHATDNSMRGSPMVSSEPGADAVNGGSPASLQSVPSDLYDSTIVTRDWQRQFVDSSARYSSLLPHSSVSRDNALHTGVRGVPEGTMIREFGRLGGNGMSEISPVRHISSLASPQSQRPSAGMGKALNVWNSVDFPSDVGFNVVESSKAGLSVNGVGLATSHCLAQFSSDPGFVERAARFSSFSNENYAQHFSSSISAVDPGKIRSKSSAPLLPASSLKHLSRTSSCPPLRGSPEVSSPTDSAVCENRDTGSDNLADEGNGALEREKLSVKLLCRTSSGLLATEQHCVDDPVGIQGMSSPEQATGEACLSNVSGASDISAKKRKSEISEGKSRHTGSPSSHGERDAKITEGEDAKLKRCKRGGEGSKDLKYESKSKAERSSSETSGESSPRSMKDHSKPSEPPKPDYIHVRARRGQATDSHSLAERVRREKISERMKFLQDLVPGCSKVTGKAVMLDEIINYVQSLQRQVEFLSMKLASVSPRLDSNLEGFLGKEAMMLGPETNILYPNIHPHHQAQLQHGGLPCSQEYPLHSEATLTRSSCAPPISGAPISRVNGFGDGVSQQETPWDDGELQSIVQMGFGHNTQPLSSQAVHCYALPGKVKVELQQSPISCL